MKKIFTILLATLGVSFIYECDKLIIEEKNVINFTNTSDCAIENLCLELEYRFNKLSDKKIKQKDNPSTIMV